MAKSNRPKKGADGLYHKQAYVGKDENGARIYKRFKDTSWANLMLQIAQYRSYFERGAIKETASKQKNQEPTHTLALALDKYIETCRIMSTSEDAEYSVATVASYSSIRRSICAHPAFAPIINIPIEQVTIGSLQTALDNVTKSRTVSAKTLRNWYGLIKPALDKYGPDIRLDRIKIQKGKKRKQMTISEASIPLVLAEARRIDEEFFLYVLFTSVLGTRPSESYALTWGDISAEKMVSIVGGVPHDFGEICIHRACVRDEFGKYREKGNKTEAGTRNLSRHWSFFETLYSVKPRGKDHERIISMKPNSAPYRWKQIKEVVELPDGMVMYDLRHYHASVMKACGAPDNYIASDMGHSDIAITNNYYVEEIAEKKQEINAAMYLKTEQLLSAVSGECNR